MKFSKKILAAFLAALMAISMMPFTVFAAPPGSSDIGTGASGGISIGGGSTVVGEEPYLTFTGTDSFSIKTKNSAKNWNGTLEYSTDANTWTTWNGTSEISSDNNVLYLRGTGNTRITGNSISKCWVITTQGTVACSGDIRTLLDYADPESSDMGAYCFYYLFRDCTSLTAAPELPATTLANYCYQYMFNGCRSLTKAPELPATSLAQYCYSYMFAGCTSLTKAPELPATTLAQYCYQSMFSGCRSLTTAPELPATMLARSCYLNMFNYCTSLTTPPELPATTLESNCYCNMFYDCESLTTAPALPATSLAEYCYCNMFNGCTSLTTPPELPAIDLADGCYQYMFRGCTGIKLSTKQTGEYSVPYSIPKEGTAESVGTDALDKMFTSTGGTFFGTPAINTTYYIPASTPALPEATVTDITNSEENTIGLDSAFKFEAPAGTTDYDDYYCDFKISFDRDLTSDDIELWGQYGNYPWTNLASEASGDAYTIEKDTDYYLLRDIIQAPMTYAQIREIGTFLCGIKSHYGAAGATINVQLVLFEEPEQGGEIAPITLDEKEFVAPTEPDNGASITVAETISENFYLDDDYYGETAYVSFTYNHNSNVSESADVQTDVQAMVSLDDATDGRKKFSVVQAPAQATEPITINVYANAADAQAGTNAIDTIDYSVYTYCRDIIENYNGEKATEMKALAKSTLDYAAAAQTYFEYNTGDMATKDNGGFYNEVASADLSNVAGVSSAPNCIKKASLVVKSDLEINLLSTEPISVTNASIAATTGTERFAVSTYQNGEYYVVHIAGIEPANMGKAITINTSQGDIVMTANSVVKMFANSTNANLSTLAKALFLYGNAANAYFG